MWTRLVFAALTVAMNAQAVQVALTDLSFSGSWHNRTGDCGFMLWTDDPGATMTYTFTGTGFNISMPTLPTSGVSEYRVDGGNWTEHRFRSGSSHCNDGTGFAQDALSGSDSHTVELQHLSTNGTITAITDFSYTPADSGAGSSVSSTTSSEVPFSTGSSNSGSTDAGATSSKSNTKTLAIAISASVGSVIIALVLLALFRHRRNQNRSRHDELPYPNKASSSSYPDNDADWERKIMNGPATPVARDSGAYSPAPSSGRRTSVSYAKRPMAIPEGPTFDEEKIAPSRSRASLAASLDSVSVYSESQSETHAFPPITKNEKATMKS